MGHTTQADPHKPIERLWRVRSKGERHRLVMPFVGQQVRIDRWFTRVAAQGDHQYEGTLLAIATSTIGSAADLLILQTIDGTVWAISTAQVAYLELAQPRRKPR